MPKPVYAKPKIKLMLGDCLEKMKEIPDNSIDMVLCDPPYGTTQCKWDSVIPLEPMWEQLKRLTKPKAAMVFTATQPFTSLLGASNLKMLKYSWQWKKSRPTGHLNAKKMPMKNLEDCLVFYSQTPTYRPQGVVSCDKEVMNSKSDSLRGKTTDPTTVVTGGIRYEAYKQTQTHYPRQLIEVPSEGKTCHGSQKPVALMEYFIETYTYPGQLVLDFAMGSGTTGVACKNLGRSFVGIELEEEYFQIAKERIANA